jgi:hypothetical protein
MSAAKIRQVIQSLPSTLDAFYERSLLDIDSFQSEQAHTLLQWIAFSPHPLTLAELAEVLVIRPETGQLMDPFAILEIIPPALVIIPKRLPIEASMVGRALTPGDSRDTFLMFPHFSVKEYLLSTRMKSGPAAFYELSEQTSVEEISAICINYIFRVSESWKPVIMEALSADTSNVPSLTEIIQKPKWRTKTRTALAEAYLLLEYASRCWSYYLHLLIGDIKQPLDILLLRFLGRPNPAMDIWKLMLCTQVGVLGFVVYSPHNSQASKLRICLLHYHHQRCISRKQRRSSVFH